MFCIFSIFKPLQAAVCNGLSGCILDYFILFPESEQNINLSSFGQNT